MPPPPFRNEAVARQMELAAVAAAISERLDTGLNPATLEAMVDLLRAGVSPEAVVAMVDQLQQQQQQQQQKL
jgi:hypothetical protein